MTDLLKLAESTQIEQIDYIKAALYKKRSNIFETLDFENDAIYLEPYIFSILNNIVDEKYLDGLLMHFLKKADGVLLPTNEAGIIYIPKVGYFHTALKNVEISLYKENGDIILKHQGEKVNYRFEPPLYAYDNFEVQKYSSAIDTPLYSTENDEGVQINGIAKKHMTSLNQALRIIDKYCPAYYQLMKKCVQRIVLYKGKSNSFASMYAHGIPFLNPQAHDGVVFFLDNLLHQCAHVIYNTLTFSTKLKMFKPELYAGNNVEKFNHFYGRFHGLFTQTNINTNLDYCIEKQLFEKGSREHHELLGRFSSNMNRFTMAIDYFNQQKEYFLPEAEKWFSFFEKRYHELSEKRNPIIQRYKLSNQPYVFNYPLFEEVNPILKVT